MATNVTTDTFQADVLESTERVLVDFWAPWCGPCRMVGPVLDKIEEESGLRVVKVNIDEEPKLAEEYGVMSIPTMKLFEAGEVTQTIVGAQPKPKIEKTLNLK